MIMAILVFMSYYVFVLPFLLALKCCMLARSAHDYIKVQSSNTWK